MPIISDIQKNKRKYYIFQAYTPYTLIGTIIDTLSIWEEIIFTVRIAIFFRFFMIFYYPSQCHLPYVFKVFIDLLNIFRSIHHNSMKIYFIFTFSRLGFVLLFHDFAWNIEESYASSKNDTGNRLSNSLVLIEHAFLSYNQC